MTDRNSEGVSIEMLPLPEPELMESEAEAVYGYDDSIVQDYARAVAEHNVKARDAEIEALRAEAAAVWNAMPSGTRYLDPPDGGYVPLHEQVRRMAADAARAERLAEALALLPDETDMIEHNPDEGLLMFCCGRAVKSQGLYDLLITHDEDCWYVSMCALRNHDKEDHNG